MMSPIASTVVILNMMTIGLYARNATIVQSLPPMPIPKGPCIFVADCPPGASCLNGACVAGGCGSDNPCPEHQKCLSGVCVGGACAYNVDCPELQTCTGGVCVGGCQNAEECPSGDRWCIKGVCIPHSCRIDENCRPLGLQCWAGSCKRRSCLWNTEEGCPSREQACIKGACVGDRCYVNGDCPPGQTCKNKTCVGGCPTRADCPSGQSCLGGICVSVLTCIVTADCPAGQSCIKGKCYPMLICAATADCLPGRSCLKGRCYPELTCVTTTNCPSDYSCLKGRCYPAPQCPPTQKITPYYEALWMQNKGIGWALAMSFEDRVHTKIPRMYKPSTGFAKELSYIQAAPSRTANEYIFYSPIIDDGKMSTYWYLTRDTANKALRFTQIDDPWLNLNAIWLFEGGVLSDPGKTMALSATLGTTTAPAPHNHGGNLPPQIADVFLATYNAYDCLNSAFVWQFVTPF